MRDFPGGRAQECYGGLYRNVPAFLHLDSGRGPVDGECSSGFAL
ncbi:MAG TPA: hypothetical protein VLS53_04575 [Candidatus Dormibacteraeota bacterium]|nr:hypothetical protein [Candidatus Dormibacteraeota bacterium]